MKLSKPAPLHGKRVICSYPANLAEERMQKMLAEEDKPGRRNSTETKRKEQSK
jgi:hypothetical protein